MPRRKQTGFQPHEQFEVVQTRASFFITFDRDGDDAVIGTWIEREFPDLERVFRGRVVGRWDRMGGLYAIYYMDGDSEHMELPEVRQFQIEPPVENPPAPEELEQQEDPPLEEPVEERMRLDTDEGGRPTEENKINLAYIYAGAVAVVALAAFSLCRRVRKS